MNPLNIINKYYQPESDLWKILVGHGRAVAKYAVEIVRKHPELKADEKFVYEAAMLHDIGISQTSAPSIFCSGRYDYICHGYLGRKILDAEGLPEHALVCERHTGSGISLNEILERNLPVPHRDMRPHSVEEQIICYADKFFSKTKKLDEAKTYEQALASVSKHGDISAQRFAEMHSRFAIKYEQ